MSDTPNISQQDFEQALTPQILLQLQIVYGAILGGMTFFGIIVFAVIGQQQVNETSSVDNIKMLSVVNALTAISIYSAAKFIFQLQSKSLRSGMFTPQQCVKTIQQALIIRIALFEGTGFFGLIVCIITLTTGIANNNPEYLLNCLTAIITLIFGLKTFPTKNSIIKIFQQQILRIE